MGTSIQSLEILDDAGRIAQEKWIMAGFEWNSDMVDFTIVISVQDWLSPMGKPSLKVKSAEQHLEWFHWNF